MVDTGNGRDATRVRVDALEHDIRGLHEDLRDIRTSMVTRRDLEGLVAQIKGIALKQEESGHPNWQMWGVMITAIITLGALAYWPINRDTTRLDAEMHAVLERGVFQRQYETDQTRINNTITRHDNEIGTSIMRPRYDQDMERIDKALAEITRRMVSREEHQEKWKNFEVQHADLKTLINQQVESLQRQITGNTNRLNDVWNARDALIDMRHRLDTLEGISRGYHPDRAKVNP